MVIAAGELWPRDCKAPSTSSATIPHIVFIRVFNAILLFGSQQHMLVLAAIPGKFRRFLHAVTRERRATEL